MTGLIVTHFGAFGHAFVALTGVLIVAALFMVTALVLDHVGTERTADEYDAERDPGVGELTLAHLEWEPEWPGLAAQIEAETTDEETR